MYMPNPRYNPDNFKPFNGLDPLPTPQPYERLVITRGQQEQLGTMNSIGLRVWYLRGIGWSRQAVRAYLHIPFNLTY